MEYVWFLKAACSVKSCCHILMLLELELLLWANSLSVRIEVNVIDD